MNFQDDIIEIKGIGEKTADLFHKLNIYKISDLLLYFPRDYKEYRNPVPVSAAAEGDRASFFGQIVKNVSVIKKHQFQISTTTVSDGTGTLELIWYNQPYLCYKLHKGEKYVFYGLVSSRGSIKIIQQPEIYSEFQYVKLMKTLQPVYPLVKGISNNTVLKAISGAVDLIKEINDPLSDEICQKYKLIKRPDAIYTLHFPHNSEELKKARNRIAFDEFLAFLMQVRIMREENICIASDIKITEEAETKLHGFISGLPFELTNGQKNALKDILHDIKSGYVMNRLIQGDVGSGKTIVAAASLLMIVLSGYQGALMAPTEVLAAQHYDDFCRMFRPYHIKVALLSGSMSVKEKRNVYSGLADGSIGLVIGTHAIIEDKTEFKKLGLVITDEQHRFGVKQREKLSEKGNNPHSLIMSATPIPRTLAIMLYADLDISIIKEMPKGRKKILNSVIDTSYRASAYRFIENEIKKGHQAYIICPMIEENEIIDAENVTDYAEQIKKIVNTDIHIEILHGKMKNQDKDEILKKFSERKIDILVSTTVVEVGINNPNATVMLVENAERFGLAELHQLRGRVGRGDAQSYCMFIDSKKTKQSIERLKVLEKSNDGFFIAEQDLKLRGPGEFFGSRQSGELGFIYADIYSDADMLKAAQEVSLILPPDTEVTELKNITY